MAKKPARRAAPGKTKKDAGAKRTVSTTRAAAGKRAPRAAARQPSAKAVRRASSKAAQVAERQRPGWTAVEPQRSASDEAVDAVRPDASVPELNRLKEKYFKIDGGHANGAATPTDDAEIVSMQPKAAGADQRAGRKAVVVHKNKVIGVQG
jgi:hypothetical protein